MNSRPSRFLSLSVQFQGQPHQVDIEFKPLEKVSAARIITTLDCGTVQWVFTACQFSHQATFPLEWTDEQVLEQVRAAYESPDFMADLWRCFELPFSVSGCSAFILMDRSRTPSIQLERHGWIALEIELPLPVSEACFVSWDDERIRAWLDGEWANPQSELRLLIWWNILEPSKRREFVLSRLVGIEELSRVMRWAGISGLRLSDAEVFWLLRQFKIRWKDFDFEEMPTGAHVHSDSIDGLEISYAMPTVLDEGEPIPSFMLETLKNFAESAGRVCPENITSDEHLYARENLLAWIKRRDVDGKMRRIWVG